MAFDRAIATITIAAEASNQPHDARVGIAASMFNRLKEPARYGSTIAAICLRRMQFSEWNADPLDNANLLRVARMADDNPIIVDCAQAFDEAAAGNDPSQGATHFFDTSIPPPAWSKPPARVTVQIGTTVFVADVP